MTWSIDEVKRIRLTVRSRIEDSDSIGLDGNAALLLNVHLIKELRGHIALSNGVSLFQYPVCDGGFAVINMGNDGKITRVRLVWCVRGVYGV